MTRAGDPGVVRWFKQSFRCASEVFRPRSANQTIGILTRHVLAGLVRHFLPMLLRPKCANTYRPAEAHLVAAFEGPFPESGYGRFEHLGSRREWNECCAGDGLIEKGRRYYVLREVHELHHPSTIP